ncbi:hypothetical protein HHI36_021268 [Cryptolaemus montrouzieri]|uniref:Uncharacterized protein n=1 Tax=Cryptolaemus montrouzieri TaxID=559131 RepID=A0ABD2MWA6_9CUCU
MANNSFLRSCEFTQIFLSGSQKNEEVFELLAGVEIYWLKDARMRCLKKAQDFRRRPLVMKVQRKYPLMVSLEQHPKLNILPIIWSKKMLHSPQIIFNLYLDLWALDGIMIVESNLGSTVSAVSLLFHVESTAGLYHRAIMKSGDSLSLLSRTRKSFNQKESTRKHCKITPSYLAHLVAKFKKPDIIFNFDKIWHTSTDLLCPHYDIFSFFISCNF